MNPDQKIEWLIVSDFVNDLVVRHEACELIKVTYPKASSETRAKLIQTIEKQARTLLENSDKCQQSYQRRLYDFYYIMHQSDLECELAQIAFREAQERNPHWHPRDHPDLLQYVEAWGWRAPTSPWPEDELLSRPAAEWVDEVLAYGPSNIEDLRDFDATYGIASAAKINPNWGIEFAEALAKACRWNPDFWQRLIRRWSEIELDEQQYSAALDVIQQHELYVSVGRDIADFLYALVENGGKSYAVRLLPDVKKVARSLWDAVDVEAPGIGGETDWSTHALNSSAGMVVRFWMSALWVQSDRARKHNGGLPSEDREMFDLVVNDDGRRGNLGKAMLAAQLGYLMSLDHDWTTDRMLPLFHPDNDASVPVWDGFTWSTLRPDVGEAMRPYFLQAVKQLGNSKHRGWLSRRDAFVRQYATMMVYYVDDPLSKWGPAFFKNCDDRDRCTFAWQIGQILESMKDSHKLKLWNRWLKRYWQNRLLGVPRPIVGSEVNAMLCWPKGLKPVFEEAVHLAVQMPEDNLEDAFASHFVDLNLAKSHPDSVVRLLDFIDKMETVPSAWYKMDPVIDALLDSDLNERVKTQLEDIKARRVLMVTS